MNWKEKERILSNYILRLLSRSVLLRKLGELFPNHSLIKSSFQLTVNSSIFLAEGTFFKGSYTSCPFVRPKVNRRENIYLVPLIRNSRWSPLLHGNPKRTSASLVVPERTPESSLKYAIFFALKFHLSLRLRELTPDDHFIIQSTCLAYGPVPSRPRH